ALGQIEDPRIRIQREIFWPYASNSQFSSCCECLTQGKYNEFVTLCESAIAKVDLREDREKRLSTTDKLDASLCRHFLAIFFHSSAISQADENSAQGHKARPAVDWHRAFQCWLMVYRDDLFWAHISTRVGHLNDPRMTGFEISR